MSDNKTNMTSNQLHEWFDSIKEPQTNQPCKPRGYKNSCTSEIVYIPNPNNQVVHSEVSEVTDKLNSCKLEDIPEDRPLLYEGPIKNINEDQK
jgi:hypothetical protein